MSTLKLQAWLRQVASLNIAVEEFQQKPTAEREQGLMNEMTAYKDAVKSGNVEIPAMYRKQ